jgi:hypothetical protein
MAEAELRAVPDGAVPDREEPDGEEPDGEEPAEARLGPAEEGLRLAPDGTAPKREPAASCGPGSLRLAISAAKSSSQDHDRPCAAPASPLSSRTRVTSSTAGQLGFPEPWPS